MTEALISFKVPLGKLTMCLTHTITMEYAKNYCRNTRRIKSYPYCLIHNKYNVHLP